MSFVSIAANVYPAQLGAEQNESVRIGGESRAQTGGLRLQYSDEKDQWSMTLGPITQAQETQLRADTRLGVFVPCVGDFSIGVTKSCSVTIRSSGYIKDLQTDTIKRVVSVVLKEK